MNTRTFIAATIHHKLHRRYLLFLKLQLDQTEDDARLTLLDDIGDAISSTYCFGMKQKQRYPKANMQAFGSYPVVRTQLCHCIVFYITDQSFVIDCCVCLLFAVVVLPITGSFCILE